MSGMKDITGQRFGRLVALEPTDERSRQLIVWKCRCDCGNVVEVDGASLRKGNTRSCGCLKREGARADVTGQRFGKLVALEPTDKRSRKSVVWKCLCDCGNTCEAPLGMLRAGQKKSCGCLQREPRTKHDVADLVGRRFGRLVVVGGAGKRGQRTLWRCKCDCGKYHDVATASLVGGNTRSCGCLRAATAEQDLTGRRFGKLTAVDLTGEGVGAASEWRCLCDCNRVTKVVASDLVGGKTVSCGECGRG